MAFLGDFGKIFLGGRSSRDVGGAVGETIGGIFGPEGSVIGGSIGRDIGKDIGEIGANKVDVKVRVIDKIRDYFKTSKMQFRQPIYTNDIIYDVMGVDGVRSVNSLRLVQEFALANTTSDVLYNLNSQGVVDAMDDSDWEEIEQ